jgi:hypothetical protein
MQELLARPEFQSAIIPFAAALMVTLALCKLNARAGLWALLVAFAVAAGLINGLTLTPLTGTRKIILLIMVALAAAALLPAILPRQNLQRSTSSLALTLGWLWVFWAVVARMPTDAILSFLIGASALMLVLQAGFERISTNPAQLQAAGLSLMLGVGLAATAAASALLGQLGLALAAGCGGAFLAWVIAGDAKGDTGVRHPITILPFVLAPVLLGMAAVIFARLPWYALIPLAAIPFAVSLVPLKTDSRFLRALLASLPGLVIAISVAFWVWQTSASDSGY